MSMLAEPRKKQKWSIDPRNSNWSKDDSKLGQKLMERMGWSKGKGLGRSEQGMVDNIKVKVKNDNLGLGNSVSNEDNWIAHQDDFNELLAQLNNCHGQNNSAEASPPEEPKAFSLEEKSKTSKKRVHYMKFAKGKDLSSRSETDLNCIFGKRGKPAKPEQESNSSDSPGETKETFTPAAFELDTESITNTVKSTLSMQEYFAQRLAQLKKGRGQAQSTVPSMETDETSGPSDEPSPILDDDDSEEPKRPAFKLDTESITNTVKCTLNVEEYFAQRMAQLKKRRGQEQSTAPSMETDETSGPTDEHSPILIIDDDSEEPKRKKKKKKSKKSADDLEVVEENSTAVPIVLIEDDENTLQEGSGQKKKKRKVVESEGATEENCGSTSGVEQDCEELPPSKKKKKQLKKRHEETKLLNGHGPTEDQTVEPEVALKKKKKRRVELDDVVKEEEEEELVEKKSKKDKKKKHKE